MLSTSAENTTEPDLDYIQSCTLKWVPIPKISESIQPKRSSEGTIDSTHKGVCVLYIYPQPIKYFQNTFRNKLKNKIPTAIYFSKTQLMRKHIIGQYDGSAPPQFPLKIEKIKRGMIRKGGGAL